MYAARPRNTMAKTAPRVTGASFVKAKVSSSTALAAVVTTCKGS